MGKEGQIKAVGIASIICGLFYTLLNLYIAYKVINLKFLPNYYFLTIITVIWILLPLLLVIGGVGLLKHKGWARILIIVLSFLGIILFPSFIFFSVWFLIILFNKDVKSLMK